MREEDWEVGIEEKGGVIDHLLVSLYAISRISDTHSF
jgi:hypothetical protein